MDLTEGSETPAKLNLTPGKYPKENIEVTEHSENLKSRMRYFISRCSSILVKGTFFCTEAIKSDLCDHFIKILHNMPPTLYNKCVNEISTR
jgi:hypothetical protein